MTIAECETLHGILNLLYQSFRKNDPIGKLCDLEEGEEVYPTETLDDIHRKFYAGYLKRLEAAYWETDNIFQRVWHWLFPKGPS